MNLDEAAAELRVCRALLRVRRAELRLERMEARLERVRRALVQQILRAKLGNFGRRMVGGWIHERRNERRRWAAAMLESRLAQLSVYGETLE